MGTGYTRNDTTNNIADGNVINAADLDGEFDAIVTALSTSGHTHDGTAAEGGPVTVLGPAQDFVVSASIVSPKTDNTLDLGTSTLEFKDFYLDGTAYIDNLGEDLLVATDKKIQFRDTAIYINSGADGHLDLVADTEIHITATTINMDGAADISGNLGIGGNLTVTGTTTFNGGTITLGDAASDNVVFGADVNSSIIPNTDSAFDLGSTGQEWRDLFLDGTAHIDTLDVDVNATVAGTLGVTGIATFTDDIIIGDGKTIGSTSDVDAMTIASNGQITLTQTLIGTALDISGDIDVDGTSNLDIVDIDGAVDMASTLQVDGVATFTGRDIHSGGITIANAGQIGSVGDTDAIAIASDGVVTFTQKLVGTELDISGDIDVDGTSNLDIVDIDGAVNIATTALVTGVLTTTATQVATGGITSGSNIVSDTDSTDDLGTTSVRWANLFVDAITATDQITATGFTGTLDGILGSGSAAAATVTTLNTSDAVNLNLVTDSTSSTSGALIVDGGVGIAKKLFVGTDLDVDGTANLDVVDIDGAVDMASTLAVTGIATFTDDIIIGNGKTIGSAGAVDAMTISSAGIVTFKDDILIKDGGTIGVATTAGAITIASDGDTTFNADVNVGANFDVTGNTVIDGTTLATGILTATAKTVFNGGFGLPDNQKATFGGTGTGDLQIYHDGSNSYIQDDGDGQLRIDTNGTDVRITKTNSEYMATFGIDGAVTLYHDNAAKFATKATGVTVTGEMAATTMDLSSNAVIDGTALVTGVLTTTAATVFNGGFAANDGSTITVNDNTANLTLTCTDADATVGPFQTFYRNSSTAADDDQIGTIFFVGRNSENNADVTYGSIETHISDAAAASAGGYMKFRVASNDGETQSGIEIRDGNAEDEIDVTIGNVATSLTTVAGNLTVSATTASTSSTTGSLIVGGGVGIADDLYVGDDFDVTGDAVIDGTLLVGESSSSANMAGLELAANGQLYASTSSSSGHFLNIQGSSGDVLSLRSAGATVGSIGIQSGGFTIDGEANHTGLMFAAASVLPRDNSANTNGTIDLGTTDGRWKDLYLSGDVYLGGTLQTATSGSQNLRLGENAGAGILLNGNFNVFAGYNAGTANTIGDENVAIGHAALATNVAGSKSTAIGQGALNLQNKASDAAGDQYNTAVGYHAGVAVTTATENVLIGGLAGDALQGGSFNTAVGHAALSSEDGHGHNTAIGYLALNSLNAGAQGNNVAVGSSAGQFSSTAVGSTFVGFEAGKSITGNKLTGGYNTAVGYQAGLLLQSTCTQSTLFGAHAGVALTTGANNTFVGHVCGDGTDDGASNTAVGQGALSANCGDNNVALGASAGNDITGANNTCLGSSAGSKIAGADINICIGSSSGGEITTGAANITIGYLAGRHGVNLQTGDNNILIGSYTDTSATGSDHQIVLGHDVTGSGDNTFSFGKASNVVSNTFTSDNAWSQSSDERLKKNITDQTLGLNFINDLRTVKYNWKPNEELDSSDSQLAHLRKDKEGRKEDHEDFDGTVVNNMDTTATMHNFIAQEVKAALDTAGVSNFGGWTENNYGVQQISREMFIIPLVKAIQELSAKNDALAARIAVLEG